MTLTEEASRMRRKTLLEMYAFPVVIALRISQEFLGRQIIRFVAGGAMFGNWDGRAGQGFLLRSPLNPEPVEFPGGRTRVDLKVFHIDCWIFPGMGQPDKIGECRKRALGYHLNGTVGHILHVSVYSGSLCTGCNKVPVSYSLHPALCHGSDPLHTVLEGTGIFINFGKCFRDW
jgi:hypothetical protein